MLDWATSNIRNPVLLSYIVLPASQTPFGRRDWPFNSAIAYAHSLVPRSSLAVWNSREFRTACRNTGYECARPGILRMRIDCQILFRLPRPHPQKSRVYQCFTRICIFPIRPFLPAVGSDYARLSLPSFPLACFLVVHCRTQGARQTMSVVIPYS